MKFEEFQSQYIGAHVTWTDKTNRTHLGTIVRVYYTANNCVLYLKVRYFNGEDWPQDVLASDVNVLECDYNEEVAESS